MKNLLKGMLIGFTIGGILLAAAAFLFFPASNRRTGTPKYLLPKFPKPYRKKLQSPVFPFRKNRKLRKYLPWSRPEKHPKKSPSRKNRVAPFWLLQEM